MELNVYIGQKIKDFRKLAGMTQTDLAQRLETTKQTISRYEKGDRKPGQDTLFELTDIFKVSIDDFFPPTTPTTAPNSLIEQISDKVVQLTEPNQKNVLRYSSELLDKQNTVENSKNTVNELQATYHTYNYYDQPASAGTGQYLNDVKVETIELPIEVDADFVVPIYGDSMEPEYHSGDYIFVKLSVDLSDGDIGVFAYNGDAYIKQLRITDQGAYLHSLNPDYDNIPITADTDFRTIGEVVGIYRES
ncbi:TPA: helix-turn-helix transcriptional regulator [Streptococcus suis]|uniref:XRE family transcriptional regulator n=2 Tax=Streptococcus suis TaxID=1307 RepID=UPI000CF67CEE|nr:XRE family transcriptional regulator [Streptococcus suis]MBM7286645.1 helix-turn-helix transcriptional regulator [Streptococcus suis]MBO8112130.1 helix-turn-helix transcriptional regulator [Streptococcus suis]MBS0719800.1 helix-turn-helix transcriptional regulator [Streptococcus suis]MBS0788248.1 helix-turn-helix transcriptional regulator [Streptococcus suis]MBS8052407.1 helix-turn-helix transcriptional regulator [Streptococcus suis]